MSTFRLGGSAPDLATCEELAYPGSRVALTGDALRRVKASRAHVDAIVAGGDAMRSVYGVNTGFGKLSHVRIGTDDLEMLQHNLIRSHATGMGAPFPRPVVRLAFALRMHALAKGSSGVRPELLEHMMAFFNADLTPVVPSLGSVGASGDLAPLSHMALPLIGDGELEDANGKRVSAKAALKRLGREPFRLAAKEGLALINGTQFMTAIGCLTLADAERASVVADIAASMTLEALRGSLRPFHPGVHKVRRHRAQAATAANVRKLLKGSKILPSHKDCAKVQDAYSLRCVPQVHGAAKQAIEFAHRVLEVEVDAVTDNPLVMDDGDVISAGNFHGQPVSQAMDVLAIGAATLTNISERRIENLVNPDISGLPPFLAANPGLESGLMISQVVAAALASENKTLAHPASVDTVPTSANREDHVSMGVTAARHCRQVVDNLIRVLAIELVAAARGLDCGEPLTPGVGVGAAYDVLRTVVPPLDGDRVLAPDLAAAEQLLRTGALLERVQGVCGGLVAC
jgi:histidine ammonia-lyase